MERVDFNKLCIFREVINVRNANSHSILSGIVKTFDEKVWILLCYNYIKKFKFLNGRKFKSQIQNIKSFRTCGLRPVKILLHLDEVNQSNAI
jgi:hypothetical protein